MYDLKSLNKDTFKKLRTSHKETKRRNAIVDSVIYTVFDSQNFVTGTTMNVNLIVTPIRQGLSHLTTRRIKPVSNN